MTLKPSHRYLGFGLGLRTAYQDEIISSGCRVASWFEALTENYLGQKSSGRGKIFRVLEKVRENYPIVFHGVSLSIGSTGRLDKHYLKQVKELYHAIEPEWVSDHLCWTAIQGVNSHDLLPVPYTEEALNHIVRRLHAVQDYLGRKILLENPSTYLEFSHSQISEWDFLGELCARTDCGILLDINNVYVTCFNHGLDPYHYLDQLPVDYVGQIHLAGHTHKGTHIIDTHDDFIADDVWALYEYACRLFVGVSTMIEWDDNYPKFSILENELQKAKNISAKASRAA